MATTTNYGWTTPNDTDLVKDGAAAIRTLGSSVDTTTKALNPSTTLGDIEYRSATANTNTRLAIGTTGQVLSVVGGVPAWATSDDANAIQNAIVDAKGDLISATAADTPARLAVGANGTVLTADSAEATGLKWATPGGSAGLVLISTTTFSSVSSATPASAVFSSTYDNYLIRFNNLTSSADAFIGIRMRASGSDYSGTEYRREAFQASSTTIEGFRQTSLTSFPYVMYINTGNSNVCQFELQNPYNTQITTGFNITAGDSKGNIEGYQNWWGLNTTTSYDSFTIITSSGNFTGSVSVYGLAK